MNILAFDTCFDACSVAVQNAKTGKTTAERILMRRGHAETLVPMIDRTMKAAGLAFGELDRVAVTHGPGTFTGSRVGMSAALGMSFAHHLPVVTCSSLQCVARAVLEGMGEYAAEFDGILVARDAKRGSFLVEGTDSSGQELLPPSLVCMSEAQTLASQRRWFVIGSGASLLKHDRLTTEGGIIVDWPAPDTPAEGISEPNARYMLADAEARQPNPSPAPLYLRPPDAKVSSRLPLQRLIALGPVDV